MIFYYDIKVKFFKGKSEFHELYQVYFTEIGGLFVFLEQKHKDKYIILSIKEHKYDYSSQSIKKYKYDLPF